MNITLTQLCPDGRLKDAMNTLLATNTIRHSSLRSSTCLQLLQTCIANNALPEGKLLHSLSNCIGPAFGPSMHKFLQNKLIHMYVNCGSLADARKVFDYMTERDVFSWNMIISAYQRHGFSRQAFAMFHQMQQTAAAVLPDKFTFSNILKACTKLGDSQQGLYIHQKVFKSGFLSDDVVFIALVDMYAKFENVEKARELFDEMPHRDVVSWTTMIVGYVQNGLVEKARELFEKMPQRNTVSWTAMIAGYAQNGFSEKAIETFKQMQLSGVKPDSVTFASILPACATMGALEEGIDIHQRVVENGFSSHVVVVNGLIDMYVKCGRIHEARELFDKMPHRDAVSWNAMIVGYAQNRFSEKAIETFKQMQLSGVKPDSVTFSSILPACATIRALEEGMDIHQRVVEKGFSSNSVVVTALMDMYAKCGRIHKARELFDKMPHRDAVSWNAMIAGYAQNGFSERALETFKQMQLSGVKPNSVTFATILPACATMGALDQGMDIHQRVVGNGFSSNVVAVNALIDMYAKCGRIHKARELFDKMPQRSTVTWTAMIAGYAQNGLVEKARELFDKTPHRDAVSWNAMIAGYAQNGFSEKALETFKQMQLSGVKPDFVTFASILTACAAMGALEEGMDIHQGVVENGFSSIIVVQSALINMYAKCGRIHEARELFDKMHDANTTSWNAMIGGYAMHGYSKDALKLFDLMKHLGNNPDSITFVCVLLACSHAGLVDEGCKYFNSMSDSYCIIAEMNHYACIVDILGRAGYLEHALNFIAKMPIKPELDVWMCLLGALKSHKNVGIGEFVATILFLLEPQYGPSYVLLSNIYADVGSWDNVQRVRTLMKERGIKKTPGCSWIEVDKRVHVFSIGDRSHPQTQNIYGKLKELSS